MAKAHADSHDHDHHDAHSDAHMVKIYFILLGLLIVSLIGPEVAKTLEGNIAVWVTLITAFGIAFVKAWLVVKHFMHLTIEKPIARYILITCLAFMVIFFAGTAPDVLRHEGRNWANVAATAAIERAEAEHEAGAAQVQHGNIPARGGFGEPGLTDHGSEGRSKVTFGPGIENPPTFANLASDEARFTYLMEAGELIYMDGVETSTGSACVMCHRQDGAGYTGLASTLVGATDRIGTCEQTARAIWKGTAGDVPTGDGGTRRYVMPGFPNLDDQQVASLSTFVRNSFGNKLGPCMPEQVANAR